MSRILGSLLLCGMLCCSEFAAAGPRVAVPEQLVQELVSDDAGVRAAVIAKLRKAGPEAIEPLFDLREKVLAEVAADRLAGGGKVESGIQDRLTRIEAAIDEVAAQRYACHSRLYWYTDLNQAKQVAAKEKKPILSLRMLGNLNEDFSCAN